MSGVGETGQANDPPFRVYWMPGCSSCVMLKETMTRLGIPFVSINVTEDEAAMEELMAMGCRGMPVLARGEEFVIAQTLRPVAAFLDRDLGTSNKLAAGELMARMFYFLDAARRLAQRLPRERWDHQPIPDRDRSLLYLLYHCVSVLDAFIETVEVGGTDLMAIFTAPLPSEMDSTVKVETYAKEVSQRIESWWRHQNQATPRGEVETFYGTQSIVDFAERSTWHCAQHVRQVDTTMAELGIIDRPLVDPVKYRGLPMPTSLWT